MTVLALGACTPFLETRFEAAATVQRPAPGQYDAPAVVLSKEDILTLFTPTSARPFFRAEHHEQLLILSQAGLALADERLAFNEHDDLVDLKARTLSPRGEERNLSKSAVTAERDGKDRVYRFRYPDVEVGSIVELTWVIEAAGTPRWWTDRIAGDLPVRKYRCDIDVGTLARTELRIFNAPAVESSVKKSTRGSFNHYRFEAHDLPATRDDPYRAPLRQRSAWWELRILELRFDNLFVTGLADWGDAVVDLAEELLDDNRKLLAGFNQTLDGHGCGDARCLVDRALTFTREHAELSGFREHTLRPLQEVVRSGVANSWEKAALAWRLLTRAGLKVSYAAVPRDAAEVLDPQLPVPQQLDHLILYLPSQAGLAEPLFVDPSCEACTPGQLPDGMHHGAAVVFEYRPSIVDSDKKSFARVVRVTGAPSVATRATRRFAATLDASSGDLIADETLVQLGDFAVASRLEERNVTHQQWRRKIEQVVKAWTPTGTLEQLSPLECDRAHARCERALRFRLPRHVAIDGDEMLVPLKFFLCAWDTRLQPEDDMVIRSEETSEDELRLVLPEGWQIARMPAPTTVEDGGVRVEVTASVDGNAVVVRRSLHLAPGHWDSAHHPEMLRAKQTFASVRHDLLVLRRAPPSMLPVAR